MDLTDQQINELRQVELEILRNCIRTFEQLHIQYFVVQGTLLGAVRHHGFIPWDDDIDIGMLREDYEIFLREGKAFLPAHYFIQTHDTDPAYPHGFAKVRNSNTAFVETTCKNLPMNHGIYIDIFPFDYYPDGKLARVKFETQKLLLRYRIRCSLYIPDDDKRSVKNFIRSCIKRVSKIVYPSLDVALEKQVQLYQREKSGRYRINNGSPWGKRECIPAEWLDTVTTMKFEGMDVNAPIQYKAYLTHVYGDYMTLPPPEKRIPHHFICALDFAKPYISNALPGAR